MPVKVDAVEAPRDGICQVADLQLARLDDKASSLLVLLACFKLFGGLCNEI